MDWTRDNPAMPVVFDTPPLWRRIIPWFSGFDGPLAFAVFLLACAGLLTMYSSGYDYGTRFEDHGRNMLLAGFILFVVAQIEPQRLLALAVPLYVLGMSLLIAVAIFGVTKKGARRWLTVGVTIQPSEILKIAVLVLLALPIGLIVRQPDLGTAVLVLAAGMSIIFFAGLSWKWIVPPLLLGALGVALLVGFETQLCADAVRWPVLHDYQQQRICTLLNPTRDPLGRGSHIIQSTIAIGSGGFWGKGFAQGTQTHLEFIPERTTDFIFASFSEEFGLFGNLLMIAGFVFLVLRGLTIAVQAPTLFSRLLAGSITMIFFTYAFVNMGMVSGILPVVGVPLPFISYGGTAMVTLGMGLGILMSIAKSKRLVQS